MERRPYAASARQFKSYPEIVEQAARDKDAIGYGGMNFLNKEVIKALNINGVLHAVTTVNEGDYPYSRTLRFYSNHGNESEAAKRSFIHNVSWSDHHQ